MNKSGMWECKSCGAPNLPTSPVCYCCKAVRSAQPNAGQTTSAEVRPTQQDLQLPQNIAASPNPVGVGAVFVYQCPFCSGDVRYGVLKCMHCGSWLGGYDPSRDLPLSSCHQWVAAILSILCCFFTLILGLVFVSGSRKRWGRFYILWSVIGFTLWTIVFFSRV